MIPPVAPSTRPFSSRPWNSARILSGLTSCADAPTASSAMPAAAPNNRFIIALSFESMNRLRTDQPDGARASILSKDHVRGNLFVSERHAHQHAGLDGLVVQRQKHVAWKLPPARGPRSRT